jgi:hypothetical protein
MPVPGMIGRLIPSEASEDNHYQFHDNFTGIDFVVGIVNPLDATEPHTHTQP